MKPAAKITKNQNGRFLEIYSFAVGLNYLAIIDSPDQQKVAEWPIGSCITVEEQCVPRNPLKPSFRLHLLSEDHSEFKDNALSDIVDSKNDIISGWI
jgi:hypothetical protein